MTTRVIKDYYQDQSVARNYDRERFSGPAGRLFDRLEKRALAGVMRRVLRDVPAPAVLDVPCGTGRITELLLDMGLDVTGGDISREMIEMAQIKCARFGPRVSFRQIDLDALDLPAGEFDVVTCIRMLHHLDDTARRGVLQGLARLSRRYVLVNLSYSSPWYRLRRRIKRRLGQGVSRTSATWDEIKAETGAAGLVVKTRRFVCRYGSEDLILLLEKEQG